MELDQIEWEALSLNSEAVRRQVPPSIHDVISIGRVGVDPVRAPVDMLEIETPARNRPSYWHVTLPLNIRRRDPLRIAMLRVECQLTPAASCIAWSLAPLSVVQEIKISTKYETNAKLELSPVALGSGAERTSEYVQLLPVIEAYGLRESFAGWEFRPVKGRQLTGVQLLNAVLQVDAGARGSGAVRISADIDEPGWVFTTRAVRADQSDVVARFNLSG